MRFRPLAGQIPPKTVLPKPVDNGQLWSEGSLRFQRWNGSISVSTGEAARPDAIYAQGDGGRMETTIFTPDLDRLGGLKIQEATEMFGRLLWCEAARLGLVNIVVSGDVTTADGGIDAKAETVGGKGAHSFNYQIKTGTSFKPWQPAAIAKELFGTSDAKPSKSKLGRAVRRCMDEGGTYVMVALGHDLLADNHAEAVSLLVKAFEMCGYKRPLVEVWGARQIANMMERYPSLCLDLGGLGDARFQTISSWSRNADMTPHVSLGAPQADFIRTVQTLLTGADIQHVRVVGEPGIGKTRLTLEAIKNLPLLSARAVYVPHAEYFQNGQLFFELLKDDREYSIVLVIDECDDDDRSSIFNALRGRPRIKLVTIDHGPELSSDSLMEVVKFPQLEDAQIREILAEYIGDAEHAHNWVSWCEGSARVAHAVGDNLKRNPADILKPPATVPIWDRFVLGYNKVKGEQAERLLTITRHIALFRKFGARKPVEEEGRFVAKLAARVDPAITPGAFDIAVAALAGRRILQGTHTMRLVPRALHVHLWKQWWEIHGHGADLAALMDEMPETLRGWFLDMLIYSNGSPSARAAIGEVLGAEDGTFTSKKFVASKSGSHFLSVMAEADPAATISVLELTVGSWPRAELPALDEARQTLVHALEKIAVWEEHFAPAARLISHLAFGESARYSNNARGTLKGLFYLRGAPTQAPAATRLAFAQKLLSSGDRFDRFLGLELFEKLFSDRSHTRIVGVEYQGLAPPIGFWAPRIWDDLFQPRREALQSLLASADPSDAEWQLAVSRVAIQASDDMLHYEPMTGLALETLRGQLDFPGGDGQALVKMLLHRMRYPIQGTSSSVAKRLQEILDATESGSFGKRFDRFVTYDTYEEDHYLDEKGELVESDVPRKRVEALAREFVEDAHVRGANLARVIQCAGRRASDFGRCVASISFQVCNLDQEILSGAASIAGEVNFGFLSGYLEMLRKLDPARWESRAMDLLMTDSPRRWQTAAVVFSGFSPSVVTRLLALFDAGEIEPSRFAPIGWKLGEEQLSSAEVEAICAHLNASGNADAARVAVQIASYRFAMGAEECSAELLWALLTNPTTFDHHHDNMTSHYWKTLAKSFRKRFPERDIELLGVVLETHCGPGGASLFSGVFDTVLQICKARPSESWPVMAKALEGNESSWTISHWLGEPQRSDQVGAEGGSVPTPMDCFDPKSVLDWVGSDPERAEAVTQALPKTLAQGRSGDLTRGFIEIFGAKSLQGRQLMGHFDTGTRSGPDSVYYSKQRDSARSWMSATTSAAAREWLGDFIAMLSRRIDEARIREERGFY
jgi:hypothetical protein